MFESDNERTYRAYRVVPEEEGTPGNGCIVGQGLITSERFFVDRDLEQSGVADALVEQLVARELAPGDYVFYPEAEVVEASLRQSAAVTKVGTLRYPYGTDAAPVMQVSPVEAAAEAAEELQRITDAATALVEHNSPTVLSVKFGELVDAATGEPTTVSRPVLTRRDCEFCPEDDDLPCPVPPAFLPVA